jgi:diaminopimelate epimerase
MKLIEFSKMHHLGNDFIMVNCFHRYISDQSDMARDICQRRYGVGADELVLLLSSKIADFKLQIINPDGSEAPMCGNALLCAVAYVAEMQEFSRLLMKVEVSSGLREARIQPSAGNQIKVLLNMGTPDLSQTKGVLKRETLSLSARNVDIFWLNTGAPHAVVFVDELDRYPIATVGEEIEKHPRFPGFTNAMFVSSINSEIIQMRCWERGGTGETLACGTGACAAAYVTFVLTGKKCKDFTIRCKGGDLSVIILKDGCLQLGGKPTLVFKGKWYRHK